MLGLAACLAVATPAATLPSADPVPKPFVQAILAAFQSHDLVALGEVHGSTVEHELIRKLISSPRFANQVRTIVVEFGTSRYQSVIDRYVSGGNVPDGELRKVWDRTTQTSGVWDQPVYRQFFETVRSINHRLAPDKRLRVLLGDPPIDWSKIGRCSHPQRDWKNPRCIDYWYQRRDSFFASVVRTEVLERRGKALLIEDDAHLIRLPPSAGDMTIGLLEAHSPGSVYIVLPYEPFRSRQARVEALVARWPSGSVAALKGTWVAKLPASAMFGRPPGSRFPFAKGTVGDRLDAWVVVR